MGILKLPRSGTLKCIDFSCFLSVAREVRAYVEPPSRTSNRRCAPSQPWRWPHWQRRVVDLFLQKMGQLFSAKKVGLINLHKYHRFTHSIWVCLKTKRLNSGLCENRMAFMCIPMDWKIIFLDYERCFQTHVQKKLD